MCQAERDIPSGARCAERGDMCRMERNVPSGARCDKWIEMSRAEQVNLICFVFLIFFHNSPSRAKFLEEIPAETSKSLLLMKRSLKK